MTQAKTACLGAVALVALTAANGCERSGTTLSENAVEVVPASSDDRSPPATGACAATFQLYARYVKDVEISTRPTDHIVLTLTEDGRQSLEDVTRTWLKQRICVAVGSEVVTVAKVQAAIPSGKIEANRPTGVERAALAARLRAAPVSPCGPSS